MALSAKNFVGNADIPGSITTLWTTTAGAQDIIQSFVLCNHTVSTPVTVDIYKVPAAMTAASTNQILKGLSVSAGVTLTVKELFNQVMDAGATIQAAASVSASVSVNAGGMRSS